ERVVSAYAGEGVDQVGARIEELRRAAGPGGELVSVAFGVQQLPGAARQQETDDLLSQYLRERRADERGPGEVVHPVIAHPRGESHRTVLGRVRPAKLEWHRPTEIEVRREPALHKLAARRRYRLFDEVGETECVRRRHKRSLRLQGDGLNG